MRLPTLVGSILHHDPVNASSHFESRTDPDQVRFLCYTREGWGYGEDGGLFCGLPQPDTDYDYKRYHGH